MGRSELMAELSIAAIGANIIQCIGHTMDERSPLWLINLNQLGTESTRDSHLLMAGDSI